MADEAPESEIEATEEEQETSLLPRSFFQGKDIEVGKKCEIKVEGIFDDEIEVSYVPHKKDKDGKYKSKSDSDDDDDDDDSRDTMKGALSRMDRMAVEPAPPQAMGGY